MSSPEPDLRLDYLPDAFDPVVASRLFAALRSEIAWEEKRIRLFGREILSPRLSAWYGDAGTTYTYSGLTLRAEGWTPALLEVRAVAEGLAATTFNAVLCNLYRDGNDSMGLHSDAEPELGLAPVLASVSLGAERRFILKHKRDKTRAPITFALAHGSILVMSGPTQENWKHALPKEPAVVGERINLTFRRILEG